MDRDLSQDWKIGSPQFEDDKTGTANLRFRVDPKSEIREHLCHVIYPSPCIRRIPGGVMRCFNLIELWLIATDKQVL